MKFSRYPGIRLKITMAFSLVFALLSIALNLYSYHRIRQLIVSDDNRYLLSRARSLLNKTEVSPVIIPLPEKNTQLKVYARRPDGEKILLFQSPGIAQQVPVPHHEGVTDLQNRRIAYVINTSEDNPAELMLLVPATQLQTTLQYLLLLLLLSTFLSVLISGFISYWLAGFFLRQVQKIITTTKTINAGQLCERIPVKESNDELQELTETINEMLNRIDQSLRQQQNFFASASHELKTPLAIMRTELEVNLRKPNIDSDTQFLLNNQLEEINRLQNVIEEFLVISQIQAGKLSLRCEKFELSDLCLKVFYHLKPLAAARNLKTDIVFDAETDDFTVYGDQEKLRLVLFNLIANAIKYSPSDQLIQCFVRRIPVQNSMEIIFKNATSVEKIDTLQITDAFYSGDIFNGGTGVGLWLCRQIIQAHNATLLFKSENFVFQSVIVFSSPR